MNAALNWNPDWLISRRALAEAIIAEIRHRRYARPDDYELAASERAVLRELADHEASMKE
jgi:hypothetical protein